MKANLSLRKLIAFACVSIVSGWNTRKPVSRKRISVGPCGIGISSLCGLPDKHRVCYDLGLGKNPPVSSHKTTNAESNKNICEAAQYLIEHESVTDYPSPLRAATATASIVANVRFVTASSSLSTAAANGVTAPSSGGRGPQPIFPLRFSDDVLAIDTSRPSQPIAFANYQQHHEQPTRSPQWDLNTPWVEMLIHEQQMKLAYDRSK